MKTTHMASRKTGLILGSGSDITGSKQRVASKKMKRYETHKTLYQRVMESSDIGDEVKHSVST